jgi:hypothetical protein
MDEPATSPYRLRPEFLSPAEIAFYHILTEMVKDHLYVFPKVALLDMFFVARPNENVQYTNRLLRKNFDFLLLRRDTFKPALAIELDHPKQVDHRPVDTFLESLCAQVNLPLVHVTLQPTYDIQALAVCFSDAMRKARVDNPLTRHADYSPICPHCGVTMVLRFFKEGSNKGKQYYGCLNFPQCQETIVLTK